MSNLVSKIFIFTAGSIVGSAVTWKIVKDKYERIAREEIESVKEVFSRKFEEKEDEPEEPEVEIDDVLDVDIDEYCSKLRELGYNALEKGEPVTMDRPYVIAPEEFDENDYEIVSLTYFADKVLVDDMGDIVDDVESVVGCDSLTHFGEYEEDSVFVRDDVLKIDYEILFDTRNYADVKNSAPYPVDE